jgi:hypothetical protein
VCPLTGREAGRRFCRLKMIRALPLLLLSLSTSTSLSLSTSTSTSTSPRTPSYPSAYASSFITPTLSPGTGMDNHPTTVDSHCVGNGRTVACVSANTTEGTLALLVRRADAQGASADIMTISRTILTLSPNPFPSSSSPNTSSPVSYNQTLDMATASVSINMGGRAPTEDACALRALVWVTTCADPTAVASCDSVRVQIAPCEGASSPPAPNVTLAVAATSVRELGANTSYDISWNCFKGTTAPDVFPDPLGPDLFPPDTIVQYHRNEPYDASIIGTHLAQQNITNLAPLVADAWTNLTFGVAVLGAGLARTSPSTLLSTSPASSFDLRVVTHASQTPDADAFLSQLAARVNAPASEPTFEESAAWWAAFWQRSWVEVRTTTNATSAGARTDALRRRPGSSVSSIRSLANKVAVGAAQAASTGRAYLPPPPGVSGLSPPSPSTLALWLRADALTNATDGEPIGVWPDQSSNGNDATQSSPSLRPLFRASPFPSLAFDGASTFLSNPTLALPALNTTVLAVFRDDGSTTTCCSGVFYAEGSCRGISTTYMPDDDNARVLLTDWCYSLDPHGSVDVTGRLVVASVRYAQSADPAYPQNSTSDSALNGCPQTNDALLPSASSLGFMVGSRANESGRFFLGRIAELLVYTSALSDDDLAAATAYLTARWAVPPLLPSECQGDPLGYALGEKFAMQRFSTAIQSRGPGVRFPVRFNGQLFMAALPPFADDRTWGILDCWQNTRLDYVPHLATGDGDIHRVLVDYMADRVPFMRARTQQFFGHDGIHWTECKVPIGTPSSKHYDGSCTNAPDSRPPTLPYTDVCVGSGNRAEYGGDGGTPEIGLAALDHFYYTQDFDALAAHLLLPTLAADFYGLHYPFDEGTGRLRIAPTGVLEYYWCWTNGSVPGQPQDCCENDLPTIAGVQALLTTLLTVLPANMSTPEQRSAWTDLLAAVPPLPTMPDPTNASTLLLAPAEVMCTAGTNPVECPGLYSVHPYRIYTVGKNSLDPARVDLTVARATFAADPRASGSDNNHDWQQGVFDAALLGLVDDAVRLVSERAMTPPAPGYRWPGFAPAVFDYAPVSELYAGLMSALTWMLLQPGDDAVGTLVLLPTWPCEWDVSFALWGPMQTRVEVEVVGGQVVGAIVTPPERASSLVWMQCVGAGQLVGEGGHLPGRRGG